MFAQHVFHVALHRRCASAAQAGNSAVRVLAQIRQWFCAVRGHDLLLHFERRRLSLRCADCGWESPGWTIDKPMNAASGRRADAAHLYERHGAKGYSHDYDTHTR